MLNLPHYTITEIIHEGRVSAICRGYRSADKTPVVIKLLKEEYPVLKDVAKLRHEYSIMAGFECAGVLRTYGLEKFNRQLALVMEDRGGRSLDQFLKQKLDLETTLYVGVAVANTLELLHGRRFIHQDVKPHNILFNPERREVHLIDFSSTIHLHQERHRDGPIEGTLAYIAPEQTGRMNRVIDHRTDFYSFGVTLYQLLTGTLPFSPNDPMEMMYSHIARHPTPPNELIPDIPEIVSQITMKLLAKNPEDRYQNAHGLRADLEECLRQWRANRSVEPFPLGRSDFSAELRIPQKLYGREDDLTQLMAAWDRVSRGATECMLVSGYAGVGKSVLVNEIYKVIARRCTGYFASGKFEQLGQPIPYAAMAQAFRELVRQLLTEPAEPLARWKSRIERALGANAGLLIDLVPELSLMLGPRPSVQELGPSESQHRFALALQSFLRALAKEHPIGIFLDDLQWVDPASLKLLETLLTDSEHNHLLIIGAYRDNEVDAAHPLAIALRDIEQKGAVITSLMLDPLPLPSVNQLIADALRCGPDRARPLADLIFEKTRGNPFFINQLLHSLWRDGLLSSDAQTGSFAWSFERIRDADIADNVVDLTVRKIKDLRPDTQRTLALAACVGHQFDLNTLSVVDEKSQYETAISLMDAAEQGLILPLDANYRFFHSPAAESAEIADLDKGLHVTFKFLHDRVQQAAYSLIEDSQKQHTHLRIGRLILANSDAQMIEARLSEIVNHMNIGASLIDDAQERLNLARLNFAAGRRAKAGIAYKAAAEYFAAGASLLPESHWEDEFELSFDLHLALAECEYLSGRLEQAEALFDVLSSRATSRLVRANVEDIRMHLNMTQGRVADALRAGKAALRLFGIELPEGEEQLAIGLKAELAEAQRLLAGRSFRELLDAPVMTDPDQRSVMRILMAMSSPAYQTNPTLYGIVVTKQINISLQHGHSEVSAHGYMAYAWANIKTLGQDAVELGKLALGLNERFNGVEFTCKLYALMAVFSVFLKHIRTTIEYLRRTYEAGMQSGDMLYMSFGCSFTFIHRYSAGEELGAVREEAERQLAIVRRIKDTPATTYLTFGKQMIANLTGATRHRGTLSDETFDEEEHLAKLDSADFTYIKCWVYAGKLQLAFIYEDYEVALANSVKAEQFLFASTGLFKYIYVPFYTALTFAALYRHAAPDEKERYVEEIARREAEFAALAAQCPENFRHKHLLILAEQARISDRQVEAMQLYDQAIDAAHEQGFMQDEALANEICARFHLSQGRTRLARTYMQDAYYGYLCWGARAKTDALAEKYLHLLRSAPASTAVSRRGAKPPSFAVTMSTTTSNLTTMALDTGAVVRAAETITSELVLENVVSRLLGIVLENAGARRGVLLLERGAQLMVEASASLDNDTTHLEPRAPLESAADLPHTIVQYVARTKEPVLLHDATSESRFMSDPYIASARPASILCLAMVQKGRLTGVLYLENNAARGVFTRDRVEICGLLSSQAAIAIENALLYEQLQAAKDKLARSNEQLEQQVQERTAELKAAKEAADTANIAKSRFLTSMSHELRTPLNSILGYAQILDRMVDLTADGRSYARIIQRSGEHLLTLINEVLDLAKVESGRMELVPGDIHLPLLVRTVTNICGLRAKEKEIDFVSEHVGPVLAGVRADERRLTQVLLNLVGNAIKFTTEGRVTLRVIVSDKEVGDERMVRFQIEDTGPGIAPEHISRIFEPFEQVGDERARAEGTGLGLPITRGIVEQMGGSIDVQSQLGQGSTFTVTLRCLDVPAVMGEIASPGETIIGYAGARLTILIVDDNAHNRAFIRDLLTPMGFIVVEADGGMAALTAATTQRPALILMDLAMPGIDGYEATRRLRQIPGLREIPIVASSASIAEIERQKCLAAGCNDFLPKPVLARALFDMLQRYVSVTWIYGEGHDHGVGPASTGDMELGSFVPPPASEVSLLLDLAKRGRVHNLLSELLRLEAEHPQLSPWVREVRALAQGFDVKKLCDRLKRHADLTA